MSIKKNDRGLWDVSYSARDPIFRTPRTLRRINLPSEAEAKRVYNELVVRVSEGFKEQSGSLMKVRELRRRFYESLVERDLSPATIANYRLCLDAHTTCWDAKSIESIKTEDIRQLIKVKLADRSPSHQKSMHKFVKGLFNYAVECGYLNRNPTPMLQFRLGDKIKKVLTREQIKLLLEKAQEMDHPWFPIWAFALYTGCRNGELYALTRDKLDLANRTVLISSSWDHKHGFKEFTKSKQDRTIEIAPALIPIIQRLYAEEPESAFVLPHHREWSEGRQAEVLRTFLMGIGLPPVRFHDLRASWATALLGMGIEPARVMIMGGWSDLKTMQIYMRKAGISIRGMTDGLYLHDPQKQAGKVVSLYGTQR